jgi:integrase/recombinase XerD
MKARSLKAAVAFYLESRRALGFALKSEGALLGHLVEHARQQHHRGPLTCDLALAWAELAPPANSLRRARRLEAVRRVARFYSAFEPRTQIPPAGLFGPAYRRVPVHIYTPQQIGALLQAARQLPSAQSLRPVTFATLFGLLACTGLRISEALHLTLADWDSGAAVLTIRQAKFGQSRYVPLTASAATALETYRRTRAKAFPDCRTDALFLSPQGQPLTYRAAGRTFAALRQRLGWQDQRPRPRLHDLRHTFTVECLLRWYRQGQEALNAKILSLAVYLGHRNIRHTYWYLTAVPELLALGSARWASALSAQKGAGYE